MYMELINTRLIYLDLSLKEKDDVIQFLSKLMVKESRSNNQIKLAADIYKREEEASTSMGMGIAIPHAQSDVVTAATLVILRLHNLIKWNEDEVQLIFGIFVPESNKNNVHLKILSQLARKLMNEEFRNRLWQLKEKKEIIDLLDLEIMT